jgi:hypothetical protein
LRPPSPLPVLVANGHAGAASQCRLSAQISGVASDAGEGELMSGNENQRVPLQSIGLICPTGARRDFVSSPLSKNILLRGLVETAIHQAHPVPIRGAFRDRHGRGMGCGGRDGAFDERRQSGRRSRMVLTPRRWRQVCEMALSALTGLTRCAGVGDNKARSPEIVRRKPLKPLRREGRGGPGEPVVTNARVYYTSRAAAGATGTRLSLRPLFSRAEEFCRVRTHRAADSAEVCLVSEDDSR